MALSRKPIEIITEGNHSLLLKAEWWERVELDEIADVQNGSAFSSEYFNRDSGLPLIRIRDVNRTVTENFYSGPYDEAFIVRKGDLLIGMDGDFRRAFWKGKDALLNQRVCRIIPQTKLYLLSFLHLVLQPYLNAINEETSSVTVKHLSSRTISEIPLPLPPLNEQKRIVAKIEELFSELDAGEESLRKARRQLGVYRQSILKQAFEGKLTAVWREQNPNTESAPQLLERICQKRLELWNGKGVYKEPVPPNEEFNRQVPPTWRLASMDALTCHITSGSRDWTKYYDNSGYAVFVMAQNVRPLRFDSSPVIRVSPPAGDRDKLRSAIFCDDLLVTIVGANTGDVCRVNKSLENYYVCQSVALLRPVDSATARYLELYMNSKEHGQKQFYHWMYGQGRPHLSFDQLRSTAVFLPSLPEQQEIVRLLEEQFTVIEQNEREIDTALKRSEALRQSILKKAFSGQLVAQDPADEPASVLLERIRAEREATHQIPRKVNRVPKAKPARVEKDIPMVSATAAEPIAISTPGSPDLQAGLVALAMVEHESGSEHFGRVKAEKIVHLCEVIAALPLDRHPIKDAAGPNDFSQALRVEHRAKKQGWYTATKKPGAKAYTFHRGPYFDSLIVLAESRLGSKLQTVRDLISDLALMSVKEAELVATVHAAWNNLLLRGESKPTEEAIVTEAREDWHPGKLKISRKKFFEAIAWIEQAGIKPTGTGQPVPSKKS